MYPIVLHLSSIADIPAFSHVRFEVSATAWVISEAVGSRGERRLGSLALHCSRGRVFRLSRAFTRDGAILSPLRDAGLRRGPAHGVCRR